MKRSTRALRLLLPIFAAALLAPMPGVAAAQSEDWREEPSGSTQALIREEIGDRVGKDLRAFYRARDNQPLWVDDLGRPSDAATLLLLRLRSAEFDGLEPDDFETDKLARLLDRARRGDEDDAAKAEVALSEAFADYVRQMRAVKHSDMIYENEVLRPSVPSVGEALETAARAESLEQYVAEMRWMHPLYAPMREAMSNPRFSESERQQIWRNLDRIRAIPAIPEGRHVLVDAAGARLWMYEDGRPVDSMKVVVGKPDLQTPIMSGYIRHAILNPYWNIPNDLVQTTIAPNVIERGLSYLKQGRYEVLADWREDAPTLDPKEIDWHAVREGLASVHVRQLPGGDNFMGKVKFEFPNPQGIYLHDTPDKHLMNLKERQLSSGCVRLEDAERMHRWLMGKPLPSKVKDAEQLVKLSQPVPIYITYLTASPDGTAIAFRDDPYGLDEDVRLAAAD
ncbi:L,D-transpeptidase family protein [Altererythrobacter soli]|uniref:L,D-transpeptidase family protein n=1 Tax=Croceibacterium soli TaxID=1739690 RepID=A0A6I4UY11_9SPHN|nr:L,D-transpeptidase family protein [Croceibacterium soli]MXP42227.1 L,D-transpeptidase family protein [Croceibacterium soli]